MSTRSISGKLLVFLALVGLLGSFIFLQVWSAKRSAESNVTASSPRGIGVSAFFEYANRNLGDSFLLRRTALLEQDDLDGISGLFVLSPQAEVSARESALLKQFVERGGLLLVSAHSESTWSSLKHVRNAFGLTLELTEDADFKNYSPLIVRAPAGVPLFDAEKSYAFYSRLIFSGNPCSRSRFACFVRSERHGSGDVVLIAGLPPFANGLLQFGDNAAWAANVVPAIGVVALDEYRHFFSDKTLGDLVLEPSFSLPIAALVLGALVFFALGAHPDRTGQSRAPSSPVLPSYHRFTTDALRGLVNDPHGQGGAVALIARSLGRRYPEGAARSQEILGNSEATRSFATAQALIELHSELLRARSGSSKESPPASVSNLPPSRLGEST